MKSGFWRRASLATLVYAAVFVGLVFLQFSSAPGVYWKSGIVSLRATAAKNKPASQPSFDLTIDTLRMRVDSRHQATLVHADGTRSSLDLRSVSRNDGGVTLLFSGKLSLAIVSTGQRVSISVSAPDPSFRFLELAAQMPSPDSWTRGDTLSMVVAQGANWRITLPASSFSDTAVDLPVGSPLLVEALPKIEPGKASFVVKSDADFRQTILAWLDKTWSGLNGTRFDSNGYRWKMADGSSAFSEKALAAWIAEAFRRGQGDTVIAKARQGQDSFAKSLTWFTVPYFGGTLARMPDLEAADAAEAKVLAAQIAAKDPTILETPQLVQQLVDRSPKDLYATAIGFLAGLDPSTLTSRQKVGLISVAAAANSLLRGSTDALSNHVVVEAQVLAAMVQADGSWFFESSPDGTVDVSLSLHAGLALIGLGKAEGKDNLLAAGQALVDGALSLGDASGFLPATLVLASGAIATKNGSLAPESLYGELADNPWYPHEVSFAKDLEQGVWAWTCAPLLTVEATSARRLFSATFPVGDTHFLILYGIGRFSNIKLYGIDYSPDSQFESYNVSGYFYRGSASALYLKMRHKSEIEKVELDY
ncbi:MAG: hypothetical protein M0001_13945 [Treponema sp.]|nr:hypothetical protein [Treponema sp.]